MFISSIGRNLAANLAFFWPKEYNGGMEQEDIEREFFELYETEADAVFRFVFFKISDREKAKDIVQEAFVRVWEYLSSGKPVSNKRAFTFRVAGNIVIDQYRKKKEYSFDELHESGFDASDDSGATMAERIDAKEALETLRTIPEKYGEAVWLRTVEGWSVKDIAQHLGESENVVSVRIHRGLKMWRERCSGDGKEYLMQTS